MSIEFYSLNSALSKTTDPPPTWGAIMSELLPVISNPLTSDMEQLMVELLHYNKKLRLVANHELPHSLSPEDMLKSLAVQSLGKWTGLTYLKKMEQLERNPETSSPLASMVRAVINEVRNG